MFDTCALHVSTLSVLNNFDLTLVFQWVSLLSSLGPVGKTAGNVDFVVAGVAAMG